MKITVVGVLVSFFLVACGGPQSSAPENQPVVDSVDGSEAARIFDMPYLMRDLDNGLRVIIVETDYPDIVTLQIPVQTGSRNEVEPGKSGFAHFFEHMMFRGTEKYPADVYADILKKAGADTNAFTTDDFTNYHTTFTRPDLEKMIEIEADRFQNLNYTEAAFRTEALAVKGEYLKNFSDPTSQAYGRARALAFTTHTYGHTIMGFIEDIEAMPDQLEYSKEFFSRWYRPEYTAIVIVGDVDAEATYDLVEKYWGNWPAGDYTVDIPAEPAPTGPVYEHIQWDGPTQPWVFVAFRGPAYDPTEKDMPAMDLISSIYFSDSSEIYQKLVLEDQSVDQLQTYFPDRKDPNLLLIYARLTDESHAAEVEAAISATLASARTSLIDAKKVSETKSRLRYSFTSQLDNSGSIGSVLASYVQFSRTPETINEVYRTYDALTAEDLRTYANQYFTDAGRVTITLSSAVTMAGVDSLSSIDELVAITNANANAAGPAEQPSKSDHADVVNLVDEMFAANGDNVPVSIVASQSASSPLVDVAILIHAGASLDPVGKKGLASLTAAMITDGGSGTYPIQEINAAMYPIASGFSAQVDKEMTRLSGQVHKDNLAIWYRYVRSQFLNPGWYEQDFERAKTQLSNAIRTGLVGNNDEELGKEVLYSEIYGKDHPYGSLNLGNSDDIAELTIEDVQKFYARYYTVRNTTIGLSGGYPDSFATQVSDDLQTLPEGTRTILDVPAAPAADGRKAIIVQKETPAVAVSFGFPIALKRGDPDWVALWLVRSWLGEHRSTSSHLFQRIREERGMNYGAYAYIEYFPDGMFRFHPATALGRQQQIFQVWIRPVRGNNDAHFATRTALYELQKMIDEGMSETDFEATKTYLSKFVSLITDGQSRQLGYEMDSQYYAIGDFAAYVRDDLDDMTLADVNRVIREHLDSDTMQYVFVTRDADDLKRRLTGDESSPMVYDSEKSPELLAEDKLIESLSLGFGAEDVTIISAEEVFK